MNDPRDDGRYRIDPTKLPQSIDIELSPELEKQLRMRAAQSGRTIDELILEILDQGLQNQEP
jgi:plasmid stability protein